LYAAVEDPGAGSSLVNRNLQRRRIGRHMIRQTLGSFI
jgi:hypothetical protein